MRRPVPIRCCRELFPLFKTPSHSYVGPVIVPDSGNANVSTSDMTEQKANEHISSVMVPAPAPISGGMSVNGAPMTEAISGITHAQASTDTPSESAAKQGTKNKADGAESEDEPVKVLSHNFIYCISPPECLLISSLYSKS